MVTIYHSWGMIGRYVEEPSGWNILEEDVHVASGISLELISSTF